MNFLKISRFLYIIIIHLYRAGIFMSSPVNRKARMFRSGRKNWQKDLRAKIHLNEKYIWMHCASLGEFEQGRPLLEKLREQYYGHKILLTFFSPSGFEIKKDLPLAGHVFYLPVDTPRNAREFLHILRPELALFIKYEFWYHYLKELRKHRVPTFLVSGVFRKDQLFFKQYGMLFREMLHSFEHFFVQDRKSETLLNKAGFNNNTLVPDTRIDRVLEMAQNTEQLPAVENFNHGESVIIGGSTYNREENYLSRYFKENPDSWKLIIAPHNPAPGKIRELKRKFGEKAALYSRLSKEDNIREKKIMIIDQTGILSSLYRYATIAVIGGGFGKGIHNTLEPGAFGLPLLFGPNYHAFPEAKYFIRHGAAFEFENYEIFEKQVNVLLQKGEAKRRGNIAKGYIEQNTGGTDIILNYLITSMKQIQKDRST